MSAVRDPWRPPAYVPAYVATNGSHMELWRALMASSPWQCLQQSMKVPSSPCARPATLPRSAPRMRVVRDPLRRKIQRIHHPHTLLSPLRPPATNAGTQLQEHPRTYHGPGIHLLVINAMVQRTCQPLRPLPSPRCPTRLHPLCLHISRHRTAHMTLLIHTSPQMLFCSGSPLPCFYNEPRPLLP